MPHTKEVVAEAGPQTERDGLIQVLAGYTRPKPNRQAAQAMQPLIGAKRQWPIGASYKAVIVNARQTEAMKQTDVVSHRIDESAFWWRGNAILHDVDGQLAQHAGRPSRSVTLDASMWRIRPFPVNPGFPKRTRVRHGQM
jgi:hypothetical protein